MIIDIPTGTVLRNTDPDRESFAVLKYKGEQELVSSTKYTPGKTISIGASDEKLALLECYSLNAELDPPATGDTFTVDGLVDTGTLAVLEAAKSVDDAETGARQIAVWAVTDNVDKDCPRQRQLRIPGGRYYEGPRPWHHIALTSATLSDLREARVEDSSQFRFQSSVRTL